MRRARYAAACSIDLRQRPVAPERAASACSRGGALLRPEPGTQALAKRGRTLLEPELKEMFERQKAKRVKYPPDMDNRADKADTYWATHLGFPGWR